MTSSRSGQNEVSLRCRATTPIPGRDERSPLVADDHGMAVVAGRKWLHAGHPDRHYFFAWSEVTGYQLGPSNAAGAATDAVAKADKARLTIYTRRDRYSWDLPISEAKLRTTLGRWLDRIAPWQGE